MRVMVIVKASEESEAGMMPSEALITAMHNFNQELMDAGIAQGGDGLKPSSAGKRVIFSGGALSVVDGPFAETKELISGFWTWKVQDMDEAVAWALRCPAPMVEGSGVLEIRPFVEMEDFGEEFTPEARAQEIRLAERLARMPDPR